MVHRDTSSGAKSLPPPKHCEPIGVAMRSPVLSNGSPRKQSAVNYLRVTP
jgi:hypothetical protein